MAIRQRDVSGYYVKTEDENLTYMVLKHNPSRVETSGFITRHHYLADTEGIFTKLTESVDRYYKGNKQ